MNFNPRAPYGARLPPITFYGKTHTFQSTRPIRGATHIIYGVPYARLYFNPRAPYGARLEQTEEQFEIIKISIHAPHTGRDSKNA